jgi:TniQ
MDSCINSLRLARRRRWRAAIPRAPTTAKNASLYAMAKDSATPLPAKNYGRSSYDRLVYLESWRVMHAAQVDAMRWCAHPRLRRGEAFSGWLHRVAVANGLTDHCLARRLFGEAPVWTRDTDRIANATLCEAAACALGESPARLLQATLSRYTGTLVPQWSTTGWIPWITPVGVYHRTRRCCGWAFCPSCLDEGRPLALCWRLAFTVACVRHHRLLLDACTHCGAPFVYHRQPPMWHGRRPCAVCGRHLGWPPQRTPLSNRALTVQHWMNHCIRSGRAPAAWPGVSAREWFTGVRVMIAGLRGKAVSPGLLDAWPRRDPAVASYPTDSRPFEAWSLRDRASALTVLHPYLTQWPDRFVHDMQRAHIHPSRFPRHLAGSWPDWFTEGLASVRRNAAPTAL